MQNWRYKVTAPKVLFIKNAVSEEVKELAKDMGYDLLAGGNTDNPIIYCNLSNIANDYIEKWKENCKLVNIRNVYHGTNEFFTSFEHSSDIGFHFGTKSAALKRLKSIPRMDVSIEREEFSSESPFGIRVGDENSTDLRVKAKAIIIPRLQHPKPGIVDIINSLSDEELKHEIDSYINLPITDKYKAMLVNVGKKPQFNVLANGAEILSTEDRFVASCAAKFVKESAVKRANLILRNPIRMSDLGVWSPLDIAREAKLDSSQVDKIMSQTNLEEKYSQLKRIFLDMGVDGIIYKNQIEDSGIDSYIVFSEDQIFITSEFDITLSNEPRFVR
ncbi:hypothetical protein R7P80_03145 [Vibrio sp. 2092]|nr:hypothetical protein [Vibrio parahaemolyticus]MDW2151782.1 hypothetical protein [Vibrio sp. 2092]RFD38542.1 hypothetical protein BS585_12675 [Vibrio parahaemolyticus]